MLVGLGKEHCIQFGERRHVFNVGDVTSSSVIDLSAIATHDVSTCVEEDDMP
jgi:hypothetical protein